MNRVTESWIRRFIHTYKNASFMDKMSAVHQEANPYYLLEWIVIDGEGGDFWSSWDGERTPGSESGGLLGVETFFHYELSYELCFGEPMNEYRSALLQTASWDLAKYYGTERWKAGCALVCDEVFHTLERYKDYQNDVAAELDKLQQEMEQERQEIEAEAEEWDSEEALEAEWKAIELRFERRKKEAPAKILQRSYELDRLLRYIVTRKIKRPLERLKAFARKLATVDAGVLEWAGRADAGDAAGMAAWYVACPEQQATLFAKWLTAFISRSELARRAFDVTLRQRFALQLITELQRLSPEKTAPIIDAVFRASGMVETITERMDDPILFHLLVWSSLAEPQRRKLLREGVILTSWGTFVTAFANRQPEAEFERLSWVFCLDPESLQQRLLRGSAGTTADAGEATLRMTADEIIRKCCALFAEGIRRGVNPELIVSLYGYLAKHDKEAFYSFVHGMKSFADALPMFELPQQVVAPLFRGDGVRQAAARKHLQQLMYQWIESRESIGNELSEAQLCKLAAAVSYDKRTAVLGWLQRHERDWREFLGVDGEKYSLMRLLKFRWLGTKGDVKEQHAAVEEWLHRHSDWVQFESDTPLTDHAGMQYRIMRPGAIDAETGELLARVLVRMEWADRKQVNQLLDDLRSL